MGLIRFIFLLLIAGVIWFVVKNYLRKQQLRAGRTDKETSEHTQVNRIVRCAQCDIHLPEEDAVRDGDTWFCTMAHKQAWLTHHPKS